MIKIGKLWGEAKFASVSPPLKLVYLYLVTQPTITTLGVVELNIKRIEIDLGFSSELLAQYLEQLPQHYIRIVNITADVLRVIVVHHYKSLPKSKLHLRKANDEAKQSDSELQDIFSELYTKSDFESSDFVPPNATEVAEYALSKGHLVNGKAFVDYYGNNDWYDKNNKKVRRWKSKIDKVWCRPENKLKYVKGAPKGFEYFFVEIEPGVRVYPESWVGGRPSHSNFLYGEYLNREFDKR